MCAILQVWQRRVGLSLFAMLAQQRANVAALAAVIRTSETELLCLQRSLALADDHAAELAACPRVSTDGMHTMLDPHAPRVKRAPRSPTFRYGSCCDRTSMRRSLN